MFTSVFSVHKFSRIVFPFGLTPVNGFGELCIGIPGSFQFGQTSNQNIAFPFGLLLEPSAAANIEIRSG